MGDMVGAYDADDVTAGVSGRSSGSAWWSDAETPRSDSGKKKSTRSTSGDLRTRLRSNTAAA